MTIKARILWILWILWIPLPCGLAIIISPSLAEGVRGWVSPSLSPTHPNARGWVSTQAIQDFSNANILRLAVNDVTQDSTIDSSANQRVDTSFASQTQYDTHPLTPSAREGESQTNATTHPLALGGRVQSAREGEYWIATRAMLASNDGLESVLESAFAFKKILGLAAKALRNRCPLRKQAVGAVSLVMAHFVVRR